MGNRILTKDEREKLFKPLIDDVRKELSKLSAGDKELEWALRRKLAKELTYDERNSTSQRKKLKKLKRERQDNKCNICGCELPEKYVILDRHNAMDGYTENNTQLLCEKCDREKQEQKNYS